MDGFRSISEVFRNIIPILIVFALIPVVLHLWSEMLNPGSKWELISISIVGEIYTMN